MAGKPRPDFGAVVLRHQVKRSDVVAWWWMVFLLLGVALMLWAALALTPRPGPPRFAFYFLWLLFLFGAVRTFTARYLSTPSVILEKGVFLPAWRPLHLLRIRSRAIPFAEVNRVLIDKSAYRSGFHVFETARGPKRAPKAYMPPAKQLAEQIKQLAPEVEVLLVDSHGRGRVYSPIVQRKGRRGKPRGEGDGAKETGH